MQEKDSGDTKICSPFREMFSPRIPTPRSAGYSSKKSFFQNFTQNPRFKLIRSESDRNLPPVRMEKADPGKLQGKQSELEILTLHLCI